MSADALASWRREILDAAARRELLSKLCFDHGGLVPAVLQDSPTGAVLMVGFMNPPALERTLATGLVHFWSRSRERLWLKGEHSGHYQLVEELRVNCEENSLLLLVRSVGPVCHEGYSSCYFRRAGAGGKLEPVGERLFDPEDVYRTS